jgi:hypothetical protein
MRVVTFAAASAARRLSMDASLRVFGVLPSGQRVDAITLRNAAGMSVEVASYGATITSVRVPGKDRPAEVRGTSRGGGGGDGDKPALVAVRRR